MRTTAPGEEDAAVTSVADAPAAAVREEREGEVGGFRQDAGSQSGAPRRLGWVEYSCFAVAIVVEQQPKDGDGPEVEGPEAAEETAVGDDAEEGSAGSGGAGEVGRVVEAEEDLLQEINGEVRGHRSRRWRRRSW